MALRLGTTTSLLSFPNLSPRSLSAFSAHNPFPSARTAIYPYSWQPPARRPLVAAALPPLHLTEDNVKQVLLEARTEFEQIFDSSIGITGKAELAELDGPFVKMSLRGRFWHKRFTVLERLGTYLKNRIPEILEVDIEDEKQLDDSPENF